MIVTAAGVNASLVALHDVHVPDAGAKLRGVSAKRRHPMATAEAGFGESGSGQP